MAVMFFGQYLVERSIVSREVLLKAIALQEQTNLSFGDTAVAMGLLTTVDADRINQAQRSQDLRIGDLSIQMGLLTEPQVMAILGEQKKSHLYIGEAVVKAGGFSAEELEQYLLEFKADQAKYATDSVSIPGGVTQPEVWEMMADLTYKMLTRVARVTFRSETCRIVDQLPPYPVVAAMAINGDIAVQYLFGCTVGLQEKIAKAILVADDVSSEDKEVLDDTIMEFINVVCGNIVAKAVQMGKRIDISPPELLDGAAGMSVAPTEKCLMFPICLADGESGSLALLIPA
jgi:CheY-specific phosphatase CheX